MLNFKMLDWIDNVGLMFFFKRHHPIVKIQFALLTLEMLLASGRCDKRERKNTFVSIYHFQDRVQLLPVELDLHSFLNNKTVGRYQNMYRLMSNIIGNSTCRQTTFRYANSNYFNDNIY